MMRQERAKQFMPFAALKGYPRALKEKEKIIVPKKELASDYLEELNWELKKIRRRDMVTAIYFCRGGISENYRFGIKHRFECQDADDRPYRHSVG